jgi:hypothetical protein
MVSAKQLQQKEVSKLAPSQVNGLTRLVIIWPVSCCKSLQGKDLRRAFTMPVKRHQRGATLAQARGLRGPIVAKKGGAAL